MTQNMKQAVAGYRHALPSFFTIISCTILVIAGVDLVLPAVPLMPDVFGTDTATVQLVLASYVLGSSMGLIIFGSLAGLIGRRRLFIGSVAAYAVLTLVAAYTENIWMLIILRFLQGIAASGGPVLGPGLIRSLFSDMGAMRALAAMGSIESLVPGLAPILGAWLVTHYDWNAAFYVIGSLSIVLCFVVLAVPSLIPSIGKKEEGKESKKGSYLALMKNKIYMRYAMSHALILGGLIVFVFTAPAMIINTMGGTIEDFITMQFVGVCTFIVASNVSGSLIQRFGVEPVIAAGTYTSTLGTALITLYAFFGNNNPAHLPLIFWVLNIGLGIRGGPGFVRALAASDGDDDRGSALILLSFTLIAAGGTAALAPFIQHGLPVLAIATLGIVAPSCLLITGIKPLIEPEQK